MMLALDKTTLLIGFYLCLHFHYCLPEQSDSSIRNLHSDTDDKSRPGPLQSHDLSSDTSLRSNNTVESDSEKVIFNHNVILYKCLGRLNDAEQKNLEIPSQFMADNNTHIFPLKGKELNCKKGRFKILFQLDSDTSSSRETLPNVKVLKIDSKSRQTTSYDDPSIKIMKDGGYLHIANDFFHPEEYCFDQMDPMSELSMFVCYPVCYSQSPCVTKCCAQDEVWDVGNMRCRKAKLNKPRDTSGQTFKNANLTLTNSSSSEELELSKNSNEQDEEESTEIINNQHSFQNETILSRMGSFSSIWMPRLFSRSIDNCVKRITKLHRAQLSVHLQQRLPDCDPKDYKIIPLRKLKNLTFQRFRVLWTGTVILRDKYGNWSEFTPGRYCVDGMVNFKSRHTNAWGEDKDYSGDFEDQLVLVCPDQMPVAVQKKPIPLKYAIMLLIAAGILLLTGIISGLQWDRQNVYEWTVSCEVISMFFLILCVGIAHTVARRPEKSDFGSIHCIFLGAASHFFWLATFCWLFIINFEIWWNFRSLVQLRQSRKWFRFGIYQLVGWGCPLLVIGLGLLLDRRWGLQNEDLDCTDLIVPNYGQLNCYISKGAQGPYLFYPIGVILGCNFIFYVLTVCKMWGYQKKSQAIIQYRSKGQTQPILIFAKLFIVMGVSWVFEIVAWALTTIDSDRVPLYWVIFDLVTLFQAISFFVIFVWRKQVLSRLWYKFPTCQPYLSPLLKLPGCGIIPNDRERMASLHHTHHQAPNKLPRENGLAFSASTRFHPPPLSLQTLSGEITHSQPLSSQVNGYSYSTNDIGGSGSRGAAVDAVEGNHSQSSSSNSNNNVSFSPTNPQPHRMVVGSADQIMSVSSM